MLFRLLLLFILLPFIELLLLLWINTRAGMLWTVLLVVATGVLGATLARRQGLRTWRQIQRELAEGRTPAAALIDGVMILLAGVVLVTPGLLTDLAGFALLVPWVRGQLRRRVGDWLKARAVMRFQSFHADGAAGRDGATVIDAEFSRREDDRDVPRGEGPHVGG